MFSFIDIFSKVFPVLFLMFLGFVFQKSKFFEDNVVTGIKRLIINVTLPALLFTAFLDTKFEPEYLVIVLAVLITCSFMILIGRFLGPVIGIKSPYFPLMLGGFETGMIGYSIFGAVFGTDSLSTMGIVDLGQEIFVFMVMLNLLLRLKTGAKGFKDTVKSFFTCPVIIAIALGLIGGSTGIGYLYTNSAAFSSVLDTIELLSAPTIPLICIMIGYEMRLDFKGIIMPLKTILVRITLLVMSALLINEFIIERMLHLDNLFKAALIVMFILPPPFIIPLYMKEGDMENKGYVLNTLSLHTLTTILVYFVVIGIYS